ncbi:hypothetical protein JHK87_038342 [Glycine soja]|nr:hypothetical protein JHK87_038342 [Glycine soja]
MNDTLTPQPFGYRSGLEMQTSWGQNKRIGSSWKRDQSPVLVFHGLVSSSSSGRSFMGSLTPIRSFRGGTSGLLDGFVRNALRSSCLDFDLDVGDSFAMFDELTFNLEDNFVDGGFHFEPYAKKLLTGATDPYLQHCLETVVLLALIGANSTIVVVGLLHDLLDDVFLTYDYIVGMFGVDVADLVEGLLTEIYTSDLVLDVMGKCNLAAGTF